MIKFDTNIGEDEKRCTQCGNLISNSYSSITLDGNQKIFCITCYELTYTQVVMSEIQKRMGASLQIFAMKIDSLEQKINVMTQATQACTESLIPLLNKVLSNEKTKDL